MSPTPRRAHRGGGEPSHSHASRARRVSTTSCALRGPLLVGRRDREQDLPLRARVVGVEDGGNCPVHLRLVPVRVRAADRHRKRLGLGRGGQASGSARRSDAPLPLRCARRARCVHLGRTARAQHRKAWRSSMHNSIDGRGRRSRMHASRQPARRSLLAERVLPVRRSLLARRAKPSSKGAAEEDPRERHEAPRSPLALQLEPLARTLSATSRSHHRRWRGGRWGWRLRRRRRRGTRRAMRRASRSGRAAGELPAAVGAVRLLQAICNRGAQA